MSTGAASAVGRPGFVLLPCKRCESSFYCEIGRGKAKSYCDNCKKVVANENKRRWSAKNKESEKALKAAYKKQPEIRAVERKRRADWGKTPSGKAKIRQAVRLRYGGLRNAALMLRLDPSLRSEVDRIYEHAAFLGMTVDHIYPLKHKLVSGLHVPWNLRIVTHEENSRKKNKLPHEVGLNLE